MSHRGCLYKKEEKEKGCSAMARGNGGLEWRPTKIMNMHDLSNDDDFLSHLLVEKLGTGAVPLYVHKMDPTRRLPKTDAAQLLAIVRRVRSLARPPPCSLLTPTSSSAPGPPSRTPSATRSTSSSCMSPCPFPLPSLSPLQPLSSPLLSQVLHPETDQRLCHVRPCLPPTHPLTPTQPCLPLL